MDECIDVYGCASAKSVYTFVHLNPFVSMCFCLFSFTTFNFHPFTERCHFSTAVLEYFLLFYYFFRCFSYVFRLNLPAVFCSLCFSLSPPSLFFFILVAFVHLNGWHFVSTKFSNNSKKENDIKIVC